LDVRAVTVVSGNTPLDLCLRNARGLVSLYGSSAVVAAGCARPLEREPVYAAEVHGSDGLGGASTILPPGVEASASHASRVILELAARHPGEITLIALGPLTNVATAIAADPEAFSCLKEIVILGGAFRVPGNVTATAEFNFYADPHAARRVVWANVPKRIIGLDVTTRVLLERDSLTSAAPDTVIRKALVHYLNFYEQRGVNGCYVHDALAVAAVIDPALITTELLRVDVETAGHATLGMSIADLRRRPQETPNAAVANSVNDAAVLAMVLQRAGLAG
jgi:purine nucleosidase